MAVRTILVPLDFSDCAHQALRWGASLAERYGASLLLLHVLPKAVEEVPKHTTAEWVSYRHYAGLELSADPGRLDRLVIDLAEEAHTRLRDLAAQDLPAGVAAEVRVTLGRPAAEIVRVAREEGVDLIVMGTHGRTGLGHVVLGSVAEKVMRTAPCPVFTVRAGVPAPA